MVVSVGNIVAGGTGKTPLSLLLAQEFSHRKVAILSRGSSLQGSLADEPALLSQRCPAAKVYIGKNRRVSAEEAIQNGAELIILDDGLQHRKLFRDIELVILSAKEPFHNGRYLPCGYLRDSPKRLEEASAIFVSPIASQEALEEWKRKYFVGAPLIGALPIIRRFVPDKPIRDVPIAFFCGIAHPERFKETLVSLGANIVAEWLLMDHEKPDFADLERFIENAKSLGAQLVLCTEKDFVKIPLEHPFALPIVYPEMELKITAGRQNWQKLVDKIEEKIDNYRTYGKRSKNFTPKARGEHCQREGRPVV